MTLAGKKKNNKGKVKLHQIKYEEQVRIKNHSCITNQSPMDVASKYANLEVQIKILNP